MKISNLKLPKIHITKEDFTPKRIAERVKRGAKLFWMVLSRRFWLKLLSLLIAILLWNHVISNDTTITRNKTLTGLDGYITNQSTLSGYKLALLEDPTSQLQGVTVKLQVPQAEYAYVSGDNVKVMLDLSNVRTIGTQEVPLRATSTYGRVLEIMPDAVTLTFEALDSRAVPVTAVAGNGVSDSLWYNVTRTNPAAVTVSGAASVVQSIAMAKVSSDVTGVESGYTRAEQFVLLDGEGNEISQSMLNCSSSSISVTMEVYPTKELPIAKDIEDVVTGKVQEGYEITSVSIQPDTITVAADNELLSGLNEILIEPISVEGLSQSISARANVSLLSDFKYVSAEQVYVNITIAPIVSENGALE